MERKLILNQDNIKEIIRARLSRTRIYLLRYIKELPNYLINLRHKFDHPLSELHILIQQLSIQQKLIKPPLYPLPEGGIPEDINYFDLALNEIKTALLYFKQRKNVEIFKEIQNYYFEQKLTGIIRQLEEIKKRID